MAKRKTKTPRSGKLTGNAERPKSRAPSSPKERPRILSALVANENGEIFDLEGWGAVGMAGETMVPLDMANTIAVPHGGELMYLPFRAPILWNFRTGSPETVAEDPHQPGHPIYPVAVFNSPGYVNAFVSAFAEHDPGHVLPLFSYGAAGWGADGFRTPVIRVDREPRQDLRRMPTEKVISGIQEMRKQMPSNRLCRHLETCAMEYGCPAGKNFFLGRYEAPLPTSRTCNARCLGCISLQNASELSCSQERIAFTPTPEEIAEVALTHIRRVRRAVVSFGQGCEGDPLMAADVIAPAIRRIRAETDQGTINLNTNASLPEVVRALIDAGLDSMRVSLNSVREACYAAYFRPVGYRFDNVLESIRTMLDHGRFVSLNYLNCPGFSDAPQELGAFIAFRSEYPVHMIQWRNLNYDPIKYWRAMNAAAESGPPMGMRRLLGRIRKRFPDLMHGYFNPPKEKLKGFR